MAKWLHDDVMDALLNEIKNNADKLYVVKDGFSDPPTFDEVSDTANQNLATLTLVDDGSEFTLGSDGASGRRSTFAQQTGITVDAPGVATHIALADSGAVPAKVLLLVSLSSNVTLAVGNTVTVNSFTHDVQAAV